jgi:hypothetical protein
MKYQQDLQVAVRERLRRLVTVPWTSAGHEVHLTVTWLTAQPALHGLLAEAAQQEAGPDLQKFKEGFDYSTQFSWPTRTEAGRASLIWQLMQEIAEQDAQDPRAAGNTAPRYSGRSNYQDGWREFAQEVLQPLFDFLSEQVGTQSSILHTLERYRVRVEWFDREELYARFQADTRNGEEVYNLDLQRFLFLEGDHTTHAKPRSASGEADLVGELGSDDALLCEGKVFDAGSRGKGYLAKGVHQIIKYAHDYGKSISYLVIYNTSNRLLQLPTQGPTGLWPPYVELSGVRVNFITVRALPPLHTASKAGKATPVIIGLEDLTNPDSTD